MRRALFIIGVLCLLVAVLWPWLTRSQWWRWIGHLPGDIHIEREGFSFHFPIVTCIVISAALTLLLWLLRR
ncbi:MAG: DUF2905 domain-containing protein [Flavobacteriales bacterium]